MKIRKNFFQNFFLVPKLKFWKIALLGGAFDPPTKSHLQVARALLGLVDQVWLFPCYVSYYDKKMAPPEDRVNMCQWACFSEGDSRISVCDFEVRYKIQGETWEVLRQFYQKYGREDRKFYFAIGQDNANRMPLWDGFDELIQTIPWIVVPRVGYEPESSLDWYTKEPHIFYQEMVPEEGSSTQARKEWREKGCSDLVCEEVQNYIRSHGLYEVY